VYSDSQPFLALLAGLAEGRSVLVETVWKQRFQYVDGLRQLGMSLSAADGELVITGPQGPYRAGETVVAGDLRAAAVLVLAAAMVSGHTTVLGTAHLRRGYPDFAEQLRQLGADIREA
jgi:UDP-N-acetylglucosamine 1-carboxyvinyltransferase